MSDIAMPHRLKSLPIDPVWKLPVPWFVQWIDGKPVFPVMDRQKWVQAVRQERCWICGKPLGELKAFVIGPMCGINRVSAEPPSDVLCALYAAQACPFLIKPKMKRTDVSHLGAVSAPGVAIDRNPGCCAVWITKKFEVFDGGNGPLIEIGEPQMVHWFAEGRKATRAEVDASIESGLPILMEMAQNQSPDAVAELLSCKRRLERLLPKHGT